MHQIPLHDQLVVERFSLVFYRSATAVLWFSVVCVRFLWSLVVGDQLPTAPNTTKLCFLSAIGQQPVADQLKTTFN